MYRWRKMSHDARRELEGIGVHPIVARGLCQPCYTRATREGTLRNYEKGHRPIEDVIEDWLLLRSEGFNRPDAAERLGMAYKTLQKALERAQDRGMLTPLEAVPLDSKYRAARAA